MTTADAESSKKRSVVGHFRVSKDVYDSLEDEARARGSSLGALVSQLLSNHTRDERLLEEVGVVKMTKKAYRFALDLIPEDKLSEFGRLASGAAMETIILARSGAVTLAGLLDVLRMFSRSGWYSIHESRKNGKETISLIHDLGPRGSVVLGASIISSFELIGVHPKMMTTDSSVMVEY
jgi:hypothetical protein